MKVNNKGFAITTLIYGLAILVLLLITIIMATLSSMRSNIKDMAVKVEEELLSLSSSSVEYSKTDITNNVFTTPINGSGLYRIEVWTPPNAANLSTYATGVIKLDEKEKIYIYRGNYSGKNQVYLLGVESRFYDVYTPDFYDTTFNKTSLFLYADEYGAKMNGSTDEESRKLFYEYRNKYSTYDMKRYNFVNTRVIKNIPVEPNAFPKGKVLINKILPGDVSVKTANGYYWGLHGIFVGINGPYDVNNPCSLYVTHDGLTTCFTLTNKGGGDAQYNYVYSDRCKNDPSNTNNSNLYVTGVDGYRTVNWTDDISLICPSTDYENTSFDIYVNGGYPKPTAEQHQFYTTIYNGKYRHHDGTGIKMTQYQPDSIVDKIDNGNFYLLAYNNEKYALTTMPDGSSVSMKGLAGTNTQKWEISKVKNYNVTKNQFTSEEYNYNNHASGTDLIDKTFKIVELSTFKALDIRYDENVACNKISAQYTFNPLSFNEPQIWRLIPNSDGSYSIKTIIRSNTGDEKVGYVTYKLSDSDMECSSAGINVGDLYISAMEGGELKDNQKFTLFVYDYNNLSETK